MIANKQDILIPFGQWVQVGNAPASLTALTLANAFNVAVTNNTNPPDDTYTGPIYLLAYRKDNIEIGGDTDQVVWVKVAAHEDNGAKNYVGVTTYEILESEILSQSGAAVALTQTNYAQNTAIGGLNKLSNVLAGLAAPLVSAILTFPTQQSANFTLYLFADKPKYTTVTDGQAVTVDPRDYPLLMGKVKFTDADSALGVTLYQVENIQLMLSTIAQSIYGVLVADAAVVMSNTDGVPSFNLNVNVKNR